MRMGVEVQTVPYEEIDPEIRRLVRLMNELPGIHTLFSCAGHRGNEETYVSFIAEQQADLGALLRTLPFTGAQTALIANHLEYKTLTVTAGLDLDGLLVYHLGIGGRPRYIQRQLLAEVEERLAAATTPSATPPSCPTCDSHCMQGTVRTCSP